MKNNTSVFNPRFISKLSLSEIYSHILQAVHKRQKLLLFPVNIHSLRCIAENKEVKKAFVQADIIFPDGTPLIWLYRTLGHSESERVSGTELADKILHTPALRIFLLGSTPETLAAFVNKHRSEHDAKIVGTYSPPYSETYGKKISDAISNKIRASRPDVVLVALGQPKQELWLAKQINLLPFRVGIGIGSALDILCGKSPRAPRLMRDNGFEWMWRIMLEPKRLLLRYMRDLIFLMSFITNA